MDNRRTKQRFTSGLKLRHKLLFTSLSLLIIPWLGYQYTLEMESFLRHEQENKLMERAILAARILQHENELFSNQETSQELQHLYITPLSSPIQLDGYTDDWQAYAHRYNRMVSANDPDFSYQYLAGTYKEHLYLSIKVEDEQIVYRDPSRIRLNQNDFLELRMHDPQGEQLRYIIATPSPGWVNAYQLQADSDSYIASDNEFRIKGEWQDTESGYNIELRIPQSFIGERFSFSVSDVDDPISRKVRNTLNTTNTESREIGTVSITQPVIDRLLREIGSNSARLWVVDRNRRVLSMIENQDTEQGISPATSLLNRISATMFGMLLGNNGKKYPALPGTISVLDSDEVRSSLGGDAAISWRKQPNNELAMLTVSHPIAIDNTIKGAVVMEESNYSTLILHNYALQNIILITILSMITISIIIIFFAGRISRRITLLRNSVSSCIDEDGRIVGRLAQQGSGDEISELSDAFGKMVDRLQGYTEYLETIRAKLSHEIRTPLSMVRSSIDNLEQCLENGSNPYISRAREGIDRLSDILTRISEATRIEQAIQQSRKIDLDLHTFLQHYIEGYNGAHTDGNLSYCNTAKAPSIINASPELLAQMLDKLISNAVDYRECGTEIIIQLADDKHNKNQITCSIINRGPHLNAQMLEHIFDPMVSIRETNHDGLHLGLGLYIAKLVCDYHGASISAHNLHDPERVEIRLGFQHSPD